MRNQYSPLLMFFCFCLKQTREYYTDTEYYKVLQQGIFSICKCLFSNEIFFSASRKLSDGRFSLIFLQKQEKGWIVNFGANSGRFGQRKTISQNLQFQTKETNDVEKLLEKILARGFEPATCLLTVVTPNECVK